MRSLRAVRPRDAWRSPWPALALAVTYCTISTRDFGLGPVPGKFAVTIIALAIWAWYRRSEVLPWRAALIAFGVGVPAFGLGIATIRDMLGDPAQQLGLRSAAEEASRFIYVLLALPLLDWARTRATRRAADRIWLWPVLGLAILTWGLFAAHLLGATFGYSGRLGPLQGDIAVDPLTSWFRAFLVTDVLFIPAIVMVFARLHAHPRSPPDVAAASLLLGGVLISHTRGIWLGVLVGCGTALLLRAVLEWPKGRRVLPPAMVALVLAITALAVPTAVRPVANLVTGGSAEQSSSVRIEQEPKLIDGISRHVILGSGLGGVLASGYRRSDETPWSFELAYLQLIFQTGVVGFALLAWLPLIALRNACRRLSADLPDEVAVSLISGIGGLVGLLLSYASNPYLVTSAGTLGVAIGIMACGAGKETRPSGGRSRSQPPHRRTATEPAHFGGW